MLLEPNITKGQHQSRKKEVLENMYMKESPAEIRDARFWTTENADTCMISPSVSQKVL